MACVLAVAATASCTTGARKLILPRFAAFVATVPIPTFSVRCPNPQAEANNVGGTFAVSILRQSALTSEIFAGVCINGKGPFPFIVDTGAPMTVIDTGLARRLGLPGTPDVEPVTPASPCTDTFGPFVSIRTMSVGSVVVGSTGAQLISLATKAFPLMGILGDNFLTTYSAIRIDYQAQRITVFDKQPGSTDPFPQSLLEGTHHSVTMTPLADGTSSPGYAGFMTVPITIGKVTANILIDTGAQGTLVTPQIVSRAKLSRIPLTSRAYTVSCPRTIDYFDSGTWSLGSLSLPPQPLGSLPSYLVADGSLGSGTLQQFSPIVIDYRDRQLLLGPLDTHR